MGRRACLIVREQLCARSADQHTQHSSSSAFLSLTQLAGRSGHAAGMKRRSCLICMQNQVEAWRGEPDIRGHATHMLVPKRAQHKSRRSMFAARAAYLGATQWRRHLPGAPSPSTTRRGRQPSANTACVEAGTAAAAPGAAGHGSAASVSAVPVCVMPACLLLMTKEARPSVAVPQRCSPMPRLTMVVLAGRTR